MLNLRAPSYRPGEQSVFYAPTDPSWQFERIDQEKQHLTDAALALLPPNASAEDKAKASEAAIAKHPVVQWSRGFTKFCPSALLTVPERLRTGTQTKTAVKIAEYLDGQPTSFVIRRLPFRAYEDISTRLLSGGQGWAIDAVKHGLIAVKNPDLELGHNPDGSIDDETLDGLFYGDQTTMLAVAMAILHLAQKWHLHEQAEGKP